MSSFAGRLFEPLQVDVSIAAPDPWDPEPARRPGLLAELGLAPIDVWLVPLDRQVAEKLHAYIGTYAGGGTTRARDLIDLLLILEHERLDPAALGATIHHVFGRRATHSVPEHLPLPPRELAVAYRREAEQAKVVPRIEDAHRLIADWLDPILELHDGR